MILFVGDKPSPKMKPGAAPFQGAACEKRLMEWIVNVIPEDFHKVQIINSCDYSDYKLMAHFRASTIFVALGNNASKALGSIPHFKLPHPSGRNRQINDKEFIAIKLEKCKNYIKDLTAEADKIV